MIEKAQKMKEQIILQAVLQNLSLFDTSYLTFRQLLCQI